MNAHEVLSKERPDSVKDPSLVRTVSTFNDLSSAGDYNGKKCYEDSKCEAARLRIFTSVMMSSGRRKDFELKALSDELLNLNESSRQSQKEVQRYNELLRKTYRKNSTTSEQLNASNEQKSKGQAHYENMLTMIVKLKADRVLLENELQIKIKNLKALNEIFERNKEKLNQSQLELQLLNANLLNTNHFLKTIERQNITLLREVIDLEADYLETERKYKNTIVKKTEELCAAQEKLDALKSAEESRDMEKSVEVEELPTNSVKLKRSLLHDICISLCRFLNIRHPCRVEFLLINTPLIFVPPVMFYYFKRYKLF